MTNMILKISFIGLLILMSPILHSQSINYIYDNAGNCINRNNTITLRSTVDYESENVPEVFVDNIFQDIKIYPNPTKGLLRIDIGDYDTKDNIFIEVYDLTGKQLIKDQVYQSVLELDLSSHNNGIYILIIKRNGSSSDWKIIKTN